MKHNDLVRTAMTLDDELDDIKRARIWSRLEDRLAEPEAPRARWPIMVGVAAVAALAVLALFGVLGMRGSAPDDTPRVLAVPAETTVSSNLGPHTRASLVGPAALELVGTPGPATTVRLRRGTLLADFTGGTGRSLRIEAPGAVIEIVGTLFAVEARGDGSCTSVAHGRVRLTTSAHTVYVGAGERYCTTGVEPRPIEEGMKALLERHGAVITAQVAPTTIAPPTSASPAAIATEEIVVPAATDTAPTNEPPVVGTPSAVYAPATPNEPAMVSTPGKVRAPATPNEPAVVSTPAKVRAPAPTRVTVTEPARVRTPAPARVTTVTAPSSASRRPSVTAPSSQPPTTPRIVASPQPALARASSPDPAPPAPTPAPAAPSPTPAAPSPAPAPAVPPSPPAAPPPPPVTAEDLYRAAETALGSGDLARASRALDRLVSEFPSSSLVDQAHYEAARIAYKQRAWPTARRHLDRLAAMPRTPLAEPGHYLSCRIAVETRERGAAACLVDYRTAFPRSPHDLDALALIVQLGHASGGCAAVTNEIAELTRRHPSSKHAAAWRTLCPEQP